MSNKTKLCPKCGKDRNYKHERDGYYMCWCSDEDIPLSEGSEKRLAAGIKDVLAGKMQVHQADPLEEPPTEPVVPCLMCKKDFVWWLHPVQLCDDCVEKEFGKENQ